MAISKNHIFTFLYLFPILLLAQVLKVEKLNGPYGGAFRSIELDSKGNMFVACDGGLFTSVDDGKTWKVIINNYYTSNFVSRLFKGTDGNLIYQKGTGLYSTKNDGYATHIGNINEGSLFGVDSNGQMYFTKYPGGIFVSSDSGNTSRKIRDTNRWGTDFLELKNKKIAYTHGANLELSTNRGNDWITKQPVTNDPGIGWTLASDSNENLFLCTGKEILRTNDNGNTWTNFSSPAQYPWSIYINRKDEIFISSQLKIYSSTDYGKSWNDTGINDYALSYAEDQTGNMFVGTFHHLFKREPNKRNWYEFDNGISQSRINSIIMRDNNLLIMTTKELYKSQDMGKTWNRVYTAEYGSSRFYDFKNKERIFAYIDGPINYSVDYGTTWTRVNTNFPYDNIIDYVITDNDEIYAAANRNTLNYSSDFGKTWITLWKGEENFSFSDLSLDKNENLYFGYGKNLYKYDKTEKRISNVGYFEKGTG
ncbi:MAG: YCF48-related protein, partial [Bacteroidota bacterium]